MSATRRVTAEILSTVTRASASPECAGHTVQAVQSYLENPLRTLEKERPAKANCCSTHRHVISRLVPLTPFRAVSLKTCFDLLLLQQLCTATQFAVHPHDECSRFPEAQSPQDL